MPNQPQNVRILRFTGKISWEGQANGLPPEIQAFIFYRADMPAEEVTKMAEVRLAYYRQIGGMIVEKDQGSTIDPNGTILDRIMVPERWIVFIHPEVVPIPGDTPLADDDGVERFSNGQPALEN